MRAGFLAAAVGMILMLFAANAFAKELPGVISGYLPESGAVTGWSLSEAPKTYRGDELFMMIDGGADIYHEYGFVQVIAADYANGNGKSIRAEIYEMESPAAAYGIYSFKIGKQGKAPAIGQGALLEDYYLNFWKGNLLVTVVGSDADVETVRGVLAFAKTVDARLSRTGKRPALAEMLLREPLAFSNPTYVRGSLGVITSYVFDTQDIFGVREGMIGIVNDCQVLVFRYPDDGESSRIYEDATARLTVSARFKGGVRQADQFSMIGRSQEFVLINRTGPYIAIVIGPNRDRVTSTSSQLVEKLKSKGGFHGSP